MNQWMKIAYMASWALGTGLILIPWFRAGTRVMEQQQYTQMLFATIRMKRMKQAQFREWSIIRKLTAQIEFAEIRLSAEALVGLMFGSAILGWLLIQGAIIELQQNLALDADRSIALNTWSFNLLVSLLFGSTPYFFILFRIQRKRHRIALDMIKAVQNFIGHYHNGLTIQEMITRSSGSMPEGIRSEWKRLEIAVRMQPSLEVALFEFAERADNAWAEDFVDILLIKHKYGNDVLEALHKLLVEMFIARKNEEKRLAMVTVYRIGTTMMVGFAFFVIYFNIHADGANYRHYFIDPQGKMLLLVSMILLFVSMILVVYSGRRKF